MQLVVVYEHICVGPLFGGHLWGKSAEESISLVMMVVNLRVRDNAKRMVFVEEKKPSSHLCQPFQKGRKRDKRDEKKKRRPLAIFPTRGQQNQSLIK